MLPLSNGRGQNAQRKALLAFLVRVNNEIDVGQHNEPKNIEYDKTSTEFLNSLEHKVIQFWNNEIYENIDGVLLRLNQEINPHQEI